MTSLPYISPGLIAFLYKVRWDIKKIFDQVKNKLSEKKAWATSETAKTMQAQFICLAHNLLIHESYLQQNGIENKKENDRRSARLESTLCSNLELKKTELPSFLKMPRYATQRPLKLIRWLRKHLYINTSWKEAEASLRRIYAVF